MFDRLASSQTVLAALAAVGFFGFNAVFLFYALARPEVMAAALANPVALVFIGEAFFLVGVGAWLVVRHRLARPGWVAFVALSMVGSLAFAVPAFLWLHVRKRTARVSAPATAETTL